MLQTSAPFPRPGEGASPFASLTCSSSTKGHSQYQLAPAHWLQKSVSPHLLQVLGGPQGDAGGVISNPAQSSLRCLPNGALWSSRSKQQAAQGGRERDQSFDSLGCTTMSISGNILHNSAGGALWAATADKCASQLIPPLAIPAKRWGLQGMEESKGGLKKRESRRTEASLGHQCVLK